MTHQASASSTGVADGRNGYPPFSPAPPLTDQYVRLPGGRRIAYRIYGDPSGRPTVFFHGLPGCCAQAALVHRQAVQAGLALIAFDRPGFGGSDFVSIRSIDRIVGDVAELVDNLGYQQFYAIAASCGAPYALACAKLMPSRVQAVGLLGGIGPMDQQPLRERQMPLLKLLFGLARIHPLLPAPLLALDRLVLRTAPDKAIRKLAAMLTRPDQEFLARNPAAHRLFAVSLADAYRSGIQGALLEAHRIARHSSASLQGIETPVHIFQAEQDTNVPPEMGRFMAEALPKARFQLFDDEGHLSIFVNRFSDCASRLLAERGT